MTTIQAISNLFLILSATAVYGLVHSLLASSGVKKLAAAWMGHAYRWYRLAYNIVAFISLMPVLALAIILPDRSIYNITPPWDVPLLVLQLAGAGFSIAAAWKTGFWNLAGISQLMPETPAKHDDRLVTDGLYRIVRHPIYTGAIVFLWASPQLSWNALALKIAFTLYFLIGGMVEEKRLVEEFGDEYRAYRLKTPMIIPWIKKST